MKLNLRQSLLSGDYDALPAAIAGFILIQMLCAFGGIGISPDSVVYISTAQNIRRDLPLNFFLERYTESYLNEMLAFIDAVQNNKPVPVSGEHCELPLGGHRGDRDAGRSVLRFDRLGSGSRHGRALCRVTGFHAGRSLFRQV